MKRTLAALGTCLALSLASSPASAVPSTVVTVGQTQCRQVALTFDAGSTSVSAQGILGALARHRARSTFFLTGAWVDDNPDLTRAIREAGHEAGNHSDTHPDFTTVSVAAMRNQLRVTQAKMLAAGLDPRPLWRPPYGAYNSTVLTVAAEEGSPWTLMWDIDTLDWQHPAADVIVQRVLSRVRPGSIVLMHLGGETTGDAVARMLPELERRGYMMVTVGEVLGLTRAGADYGGRAVHVQPGDTLFRIASCFNTTVPVLAAANGIADVEQIEVGQRLYVPLRDEVVVTVLGRRLDLFAPARVVNGRTLAHVRAVAEALGAVVSWNGVTQEVSLTKGDTTVLLRIGSTAAYVNGALVTLDAAPVLEENRTQVPLRFVAESLGATVGWDQESRTASVILGE